MPLCLEWDASRNLYVTYHLRIGALLHQHVPKGSDLLRYSQAHLNKIALRLNQRPRKTLGFE